MTDPIYDTHAHVFSSDIARYPVTPGTIRQTPEQVIAKITANPLPGVKLLELFDGAGATGGAAVQYSAVYKTDNSYLLDAAAESGGRLAAVIILNARDAETPARLRDLVENRGTTGLRLSGPIADDGSMDWLDGPEALRTWEEADRLHLTMVVMWQQDVPDARGFARLVALHDRFPNVRIAIDHFGFRALADVDFVGGDLEDLGGGRGVDVFAFVEDLFQHLLVSDVSEDAELDLAVVGGEQAVALLGDEAGADGAADLGPDRDVLQVRVGA